MFISPFKVAYSSLIVQLQANLHPDVLHWRVWTARLWCPYQCISLYAWFRLWRASPFMMSRLLFVRTPPKSYGPTRGKSSVTISGGNSPVMDLMIIWKGGNNHKYQKTKQIWITTVLRREWRNVETLLTRYWILCILSSFSIYQIEASNPTS